MREKVTINGTLYSVGLTDVWGGKMWSFCKYYQDRMPSTRRFWTKKELESYLRTLKNKVVKREVLAILHNVHGRAIRYAH